ncbi:MAG: 4-hydroxythreonine-4-phosphate dehydrogenase PdxA [Acidobacteria bacterium]|nr:4-hydroxythreonine-4-phosphate dehydrogenase PdxA [Acidobacteriota bacterium]MCW5970513.1 4-hydroxythreonine-4-phosphate dehydrogenase PdxA [Blastocatellales bacterium]
MQSQPPQNRRARIGITIGDPAGIGPEVALRAASSDEVLGICSPVLVGDASYLVRWARIFGLTSGFEILPAGFPIPSPEKLPDAAIIYDTANLPEDVDMGRDSAAAGRAAAGCIEAAARLCLSGELDAVATAPISKRALALAGYSYPGHTEMFAALASCDDFAMTFFAPSLRVALLTTHVALAQVPSLVKRAGLERLIRLLDRELQRYGFDRPRIAVAALNPHAGEGGLFGVEEAREMLPAIDACRADGIEASGPHPGDTVFVRASRGAFDIVVSCYHDQGLIPVKCLSFGEAVNVTLGLPFIRTSVDHGAAFDIAGKGRAEYGSMIAAVRLAAELHARRRQER